MSDALVVELVGAGQDQILVLLFPLLQADGAHTLHLFGDLALGQLPDFGHSGTPFFVKFNMSPPEVNPQEVCFLLTIIAHAIRLQQEITEVVQLRLLLGGLYSHWWNYWLSDCAVHKPGQLIEVALEGTMVLRESGQMTAHRFPNIIILGSRPPSNLSQITLIVISLFLGVQQAVSAALLRLVGAHEGLQPGQEAGLVLLGHVHALLAGAPPDEGGHEVSLGVGGLLAGLLLHAANFIIY